MINPVEAFKMIGNASQAMNIAQRIQKIDPNKNGTPELQEMIAKGKEIVADLNELNKDCLEFVALYSGVITEIDEILKEGK